MVLTAIVSSTARSASSAASNVAGAGAGVGAGVTSMTSTIGAGVGGIFVAAALIYLLAYLDLYDAKEDTDPEARKTIVATIVPLFIAFGGIVLFKTLQVL